MASWICRMCSSANPEGECECFVCGYVRDEADIMEERLAAEEAAREAARLAAIEAERAAEAERARRAEEARRAEAERVRRAEAERLRREAERRARAEAADRERIEAERRRAAEEELARHRALARERHGADYAFISFRVVFFICIGAFIAAALWSLIESAVYGYSGQIGANLTATLDTIGSKLSLAAETVGAYILPRFIIDLGTNETLLLILAGLGGRLGDITLTLIPAVLDRLSQSGEALLVCLGGLYASAGGALSEATAHLAVGLAALGDALNSFGQRLGELWAQGVSSVTGADAAIRGAIDRAAENIGKLKRN